MREPIIAVGDLAKYVYGASFNGTHLRCDHAHNQLFYMDRPTSNIYLEAEGQPELLGDFAAGWFLTQIRRYEQERAAKMDAGSRHA